MRPWLSTAVAAAIAWAAMATAGAAEVNIDNLAGVYKKAFKNSNIGGDTYTSEDILEIVKVTPKAAYVRAHFEFFNGHVCNIWGMAKVEGGALVYRGDTNAQGKPCVLSVKTANGKIMLGDLEGACAIATCGARGMYNGASFALKARRPIRYMDVLLDSDEYKDAVDEHEGKPRTRMP
jgi:hypothetical protein